MGSRCDVLPMLCVLANKFVDGCPDYTCICFFASPDAGINHHTHISYNIVAELTAQVVDYGHTFSPEIEMAALHGTNSMLLHGEAVNIDMAITTQVLFCALPCFTLRCSMRMLLGPWH